MSACVYVLRKVLAQCHAFTFVSLYLPSVKKQTNKKTTTTKNNFPYTTTLLNVLKYGNYHFHGNYHLHYINDFRLMAKEEEKDVTGIIYYQSVASRHPLPDRKMSLNSWRLPTNRQCERSANEARGCLVFENSKPLWGCAGRSVSSTSLGVVHLACLSGRSYCSPGERSTRSFKSLCQLSFNRWINEP